MSHIKNPEQYLKAYIKRNYPSLVLQAIMHNPAGLCAECILCRDEQQFHVQLLLPKTAPPKALPLVAQVQWKIDGVQCRWNYTEHDVTDEQWHQNSIRVHLFEAQNTLFQVYVGEGDLHNAISDTVICVRQVTGKPLQIKQLELFLRRGAAKSWNMQLKVRKDEKDILRNISK